MELEERISKFLHSAVSSIRVRSALNPILWLCVVSPVICLYFAKRFDSIPVIMYALVGAGLLPILTACIMYVYFGLKNPEKLQSEDYQLKQQTISLVGMKVNTIPLTGLNLEAIASETVKQIQAVGKDQLS